jgi:hypothetical protein
MKAVVIRAYGGPEELKFEDPIREELPETLEQTNSFV